MTFVAVSKRHSKHVCTPLVRRSWKIVSSDVRVDTLELRSYAPRGLWFPALVWFLHAALRSSRWWVLGSPVRVALFALFVCVCASCLPFGSCRCNSGLGHKFAVGSPMAVYDLAIAKQVERCC